MTGRNDPHLRVEPQSANGFAQCRSRESSALKATVDHQAQHEAHAGSDLQHHEADHGRDGRLKAETAVVVHAERAQVRVDGGLRERKDVRGDESALCVVEFQR
ncbi:hypothetical protein HNQ08_004453 [Deinococcus humi]|uniref:Uncharacterized protein n=1 Tax=Deinococcus humi TaxID=662880 RepID=A0A7W8JY14_9DEIO|nr:hypothetical protein [Deinococcus humi]GGO36292.1 hypothetical protein GCM10008949_39980 [Deinococcus humi]